MSTVRDREATEHFEFLARAGSAAAAPEQGSAGDADVVVCSFEVGTEESADTALQHVRELLGPAGHAVFLEGSAEPGRVALAAVSPRPDLAALRQLDRAGFDVYHAEWFLLADLRRTLRSREPRSPQAP